VDRAVETLRKFRDFLVPTDDPVSIGHVTDFEGDPCSRRCDGRIRRAGRPQNLVKNQTASYITLDWGEIKLLVKYATPHFRRFILQIQSVKPCNDGFTL